MTLFGLTSQQAAAVGTSWLRLARGFSQYAGITRGVGIPATLRAIGLSGPLKPLAATTKDGEQAAGIAGTATGAGIPAHTRGTLWITTGSNPLPVEFDIRSATFTLSEHLTHCGQPVHVHVPAPVIDLAALQA